MQTIWKNCGILFGKIVVFHLEELRHTQFSLIYTRLYRYRQSSHICGNFNMSTITFCSAEPSGGVDDNINNIAPKSTSLGAQGITQSVNRYANLIIKDNLCQCKLSISVNSQVIFFVTKIRFTMFATKIFINQGSYFVSAQKNAIALH